MSNVEKYIVYVIATLFLYGIIATRAYIAQRRKLKWYKRHYDAQPKKAKANYKPSTCEKVIDLLIILSPIK